MLLLGRLDLGWLLLMGHEQGGIVATWSCFRLETHFECLTAIWLGHRLLGNGELGAIEDIHCASCLIPPALC